MSTEEFCPTHFLTIGTGQNKMTWEVQAIGPIGRRKSDGVEMYNAVISPKHRASGVHYVSNIPATQLRPYQLQKAMVS